MNSRTIHLIELRDPRRGLASSYFNSLMLCILAVWAERLGWRAHTSFPRFSDVDYDPQYDVIALSLYSFLAPQGYEVARRFRAMGKIVIIGGPHARGCFEEAREHADVVVDRCNEDGWREILLAIEQKRITAGTHPGVFFSFAEMNRIPPYAELHKFYGDSKVPMLLSSLGCPHDCEWCTDWNSSYFKRTVDDVVDDVRQVRKPFFLFADPNFGVNRKYTSELLRRMIPLKKKYFMETSLVWLLDDDYLRLLRDSGCIGVEIGLESLSTNYKKNGIKKTQSPLEEAIARIDRIKKHIPLLQVNIVLGLDGDTPETFDLVAELYRRSKTDTIGLHIVTPFPGTPFFDRMNAEGRIADTDWSHYNCETLTVRLRSMETPEFYNQYIRLRHRVNSPWMVLRKVIGHLFRHKDLYMTYIIFRVLVFRSWMSFRHDVPALREARRRWLEENAALEANSHLLSPAP